MSTTKTIESLIGIASRLAALMGKEVEILREMRTGDIAPLQAEKSALTDAYEAHIRILGENRAALKTVEPALRAEFVQVAAEFEAALAENERALHAARTAQSRLIKAIVEAVGKDRNKHSGYSPCGAGVIERPKDQTMSLTFDARL